MFLYFNAIFIYYLIDLTMIIFLNQRLYTEDIIKYGMDIGYVVDIEKTAVLFLIIIIIYLFNRLLISIDNKYLAKIIIFLLLIVLYSHLQPKINSGSPREIYTKNIIQTNINNTSNTHYSREFISNFHFEPNYNCVTQKPTKPENIFIFLVESWSIYHSKYYGGDNDWTPKLDYIAENNIAYRNFYSNGYTTEFALLSTIYSQPAIPYGQSIGLTGQIDLHNFKINNSYLNSIHKLGYESFFVTSGDLSFQQKGNWLSKVGFDHIIGADDYTEDNRFSFNSVEDKFLFEKVIKLSKEQKTSKNIIFVENVTTHPPFVTPTPNGVVSSEEYAFKYLDYHLSETINKLNNGRNLILVLSDHRAMSPLRDYELHNSGTMAGSHTPAFMIWQGLDIEYHTNFQQSDILSSISGLISGNSCTSNIVGTLFPVESLNLLNACCS
ncbi:sulfatase [Vibrio sp. JCM 19236]|nr:sulfatase [Vibrio sp. JCM 19236]